MVKSLSLRESLSAHTSDDCCLPLCLCFGMNLCPLARSGARRWCQERALSLQIVVLRHCMPTAQHGSTASTGGTAAPYSSAMGCFQKGPSVRPLEIGVSFPGRSSVYVYVYSCLCISAVREWVLHFSAKTAISILPLPCRVAFLLLPRSSPILSPPLPSWITTLTLLMLSCLTGMCHAPHDLPRRFFCTAVLLPDWEMWMGTAGSIVTTGCWDMSSGHPPTWEPSGPCTAAAHNAQPTNGFQHNSWSSAGVGEGEKEAVARG